MELNRRQLMAVGGAVVAIAGLNATRAFAAPDTGAVAPALVVGHPRGYGLPETRTFMTIIPRTAVCLDSNPNRCCREISQ